MWHPSARRHLQLHFLRDSGDNFTFLRVAETGTAPRSAPPFNLGAIREGIHEEMDRFLAEAAPARKAEGDTKKSARKIRWLSPVLLRGQWFEIVLDSGGSFPVRSLEIMPMPREAREFLSGPAKMKQGQCDRQLVSHGSVHRYAPYFCRHSS